MRYMFLAALFTVCVGLLGLNYLWEVQRAQAQENTLVDAGVSTHDEATPEKPKEVVVGTPDPQNDPSKAWQFLVSMYKLGIWPLVASLVLMLSRFTVKRMQPGPENLPLTGWRMKSLAIAAALVAISGPSLEVLLKTGSIPAVAAGIIYAYGLLKDAFNPPKGSAKKAEA